MGDAIHGETTINGHCRFRWREGLESDGGSTVEVDDEHCDACVRALGSVARIRGFRVVDRRTGAAR